jgi:hypothetical protein
MTCWPSCTNGYHGAPVTTPGGSWRRSKQRRSGRHRSSELEHLRRDRGPVGAEFVERPVRHDADSKPPLDIVRQDHLGTANWSRSTGRIGSTFAGVIPQKEWADGALGTGNVSCPLATNFVRGAADSLLAIARRVWARRHS